MSTTTVTTATSTLTEPYANAAYIPRGPAQTKLSFYEPPVDGSVPYFYVNEPEAGVARRNYTTSEHLVEIEDIRGHESEYNLEKHAFAIVQNVPSATTYETFNSDEEVKRVYYPEVERLLLENVPDAQRVILFDHTIRKGDVDAPRRPVNQAHVDQTDRAAELRVRLHVPDPAEAGELLKGRYRIINVWRPINGVVQSWPLAFASATSIQDSDFAAVEHRYPERTGETMGVKYNPNAQWKYISGIDNDERILLKCNDNKDGVGKQVPHSAFEHPRTPAGAKLRESIEVRALVFG